MFMQHGIIAGLESPAAALPQPRFLFAIIGVLGCKQAQFAAPYGQWPCSF